MKKVTFLAVAVMLIATLAPMGVFAQSADSQLWSTSITYYTPDPTGGTLQIKYYAEGSATSIDANPIPLSGHKAGSLFIGNTTEIPEMTLTFSGGAVLEADVPIIATAVNIAGDDYPRTLYSGFAPEAASTNFFIPTVLYQKFNSNTLVSIQNVETSDVDATLTVYDPNPTVVGTYTIKGQSAKLVPAADMGLSPGFTGSGVVEATGRVVAAAQENYIDGRGAKAFEGLAADAGAETIYMASMMCEAFGGQTSYYAIQAVDADATVEIEHYDKDGNLVYTKTGLSIDEGSKISENPCKYTDVAPALQGLSGSAVIKSTNGAKLIAMGKIAGGGLTPTAFLGQSAGAMKVAAPYIRWKVDATAGERSYVAVMNVGLGDATDVTATYYDNTGAAAATVDLATVGDPLPRFIKANTNWGNDGTGGDFGVSPFGGAIEIQSDQPVVVVVRVSKSVSYGDVTLLAEDYNGQEVP
jgi:hypothetical protein